MNHLTLCLLLCCSFLARLYADVAGSAEDVHPISVGEKAPNPSVRTLEGESVELDEVLNGQPSILVFYRGGWCPYCTRHLSALQHLLPEIKKEGWKLVALSPDRPEKLRETLAEKKLSYTLLSDSSLKAAATFGLAFQLNPQTVTVLEGYGIDLVDASGEDHLQLPVPAVILVDSTGVVTFVHHDPDYKKRLDSDELLRALRSDP